MTKILFVYTLAFLISGTAMAKSSISNHIVFETEDARGSLHVYTKSGGHLSEQGHAVDVLLRASCGKTNSDWLKFTMYDGEGVCQFIGGSFKFSEDHKKIHFNYRKRDEAFYEKNETDGGKPRCQSRVSEHEFDVTLQTGLCSLEK
jgi:hypothetical protein